MSDVIQLIPAYGNTNVGRPVKTLYSALADTSYSLEDQPGAMDDRDVWREKDGERERDREGVRELSAVNVTWWW